MSEAEVTVMGAEITKRENDGANLLELARMLVADPDSDPEKLRAILGVKRDWEADEARKAFARAMAAFQADCPIIEKGDKAHNKAYARIDRIWRTIRPLMKEHGLCAMWTCQELRDAVCHVEGALMHSEGHSIPISGDVPLPAAITGQNAAQQMGSAMTYAKRYVLCGALNIVTGEDDDDGNAGDAETITRAKAHQLRKRVHEVGADERKFLAFAGVKCGDSISEADYEGIRECMLQSLNAMLEKRERANAKEDDHA
jgi:hypothetical protein